MMHIKFLGRSLLNVRRKPKKKQVHEKQQHRPRLRRWQRRRRWQWLTELSASNNVVCTHIIVIISCCEFCDVGANLSGVVAVIIIVVCTRREQTDLCANVNKCRRKTETAVRRRTCRGNNVTANGTSQTQTKSQKRNLVLSLQWANNNITEIRCNFENCAECRRIYGGLVVDGGT